MTNALLEFVEFVLDILVLRHVRRARGLKEHSVGEDTADMAGFYASVIMLSLAGAVIMFVLHFWLNWPFWLSFGLPAAVVGFYAGSRLRKLYRNTD